MFRPFSKSESNLLTAQFPFICARNVQNTKPCCSLETSHSTVEETVVAGVSLRRYLRNKMSSLAGLDLKFIQFFLPRVFKQVTECDFHILVPYQSLICLLMFVHLCVHISTDIFWHELTNKRWKKIRFHFSGMWDERHEAARSFQNLLWLRRKLGRNSLPQHCLDKIQPQEPVSIRLDFGCLFEPRLFHGSQWTPFGTAIIAEKIYSEWNFCFWKFLMPCKRQLYTFKDNSRWSVLSYYCS